MKLLSSKVVLFVFVVLSILVIPFLYQNCEMAGLKELHQKSAGSESVTTTTLQVFNISTEVFNGKGTLVAYETSETATANPLTSLCTGETPIEDEATSVSIAIITRSLYPNSYLCRQLLPTEDEEFWPCEEVLNLEGASGGSFRWNNEDTYGGHPQRAVLSFNGLSEGTYKLEIFASGSDDADESEGDIQPLLSTPILPVSFIVEDCSSISGTEEECHELTTSSHVGKGRDYCACPPFMEESVNASCQCFSNLRITTDGQCVCPNGRSPSADGACLDSTPLDPQNWECRPTCADYDGDCTRGDWYDCARLHDGRSNNFGNGHLSAIPQNCCLPEEDTTTPEGEECSPTCSDYNGDCIRGDWYDCGRLHDGLSNNFAKGHLSANQENCCLPDPATLTCAQAKYDCTQHGKIRRGTKKWNNNRPANEENCCRVAPN